MPLKWRLSAALPPLLPGLPIRSLALAGASILPAHPSPLPVAQKSGQDGLREREQDRIRERMRLRMQRQRPPRDNALPADLPVPPPDLGGAPYAPVDVPRGPPVDRYPSPARHCS